MIRKRNYPYLAGVIDGDGGVYIEATHVGKYPTFQAVVCVANANTQLIKWLIHHYGGCKVKNSSKGDTPNFGSVVKKKYQNQHDNWQWRLTGNVAIHDLLVEVMPHLTANRYRAEAALALTKLHCKYRAVDERRACYEKYVAAPMENYADKKSPWSYASGLLDSEGSISITKAKTPQGFRPLFRVSNDNPVIIDAMKQLFPESKIYSSLEKTELGERLRYTWYYKPTDEKISEHFLLALLPYLIVKKEQALLALSLMRVPLENRSIDYCTQIRERVIALNDAMGDPDLLEPVGSVETQTPTSEIEKIESGLRSNTQELKTESL